jgi:putative Mg2+ transporter-C (MgtC) family protein
MGSFISNPQYLLLAEVVLAMLFGALIGLEREFNKKPAGLRTHMLVAGAAALLVGLSQAAVENSTGLFDPGIIRTDPIRIMEAVVTGISFLGAGTIIRYQSSPGVEGLTTAASVLVAGGIGISVALSQFALASGVTFIVLITLYGVGFVEKWMDKHHLRAEKQDEPQQPETGSRRQGQKSLQPDQ